jgi:hypothetical protein
MAEGFLAPWRKLAAPPKRLEELVVGTPSTVYVRAADGNTYRCSDWEDGCWVQDDIPLGFPADYAQTVKECDFRQIAFRWLRDSRRAVNCIQGVQTRAGCQYRFTYVLDMSSDVYKWSHRVCDDGRRLGLCALVAGFGAVLGLAVGTLLDLDREGSRP